MKLLKDELIEYSEIYVEQLFQCEQVYAPAADYSNPPNTPPRTPHDSTRSLSPSINFPRLSSFVSSVMSRTRASTATLSLALFYLRRLKQIHPACKGSYGSGHRLIFASLITASKYLYDDTYDNKAWKMVTCGLFQQKEVNQMEHEFLFFVKYELFVKEFEWNEFLEELEFGMADACLARLVPRRKTIGEGLSERFGAGLFEKLKFVNLNDCGIDIDWDRVPGQLSDYNLMANLSREISMSSKCSRSIYSEVNSQSIPKTTSNRCFNPSQSTNLETFTTTITTHSHNIHSPTHNSQQPLHKCSPKVSGAQTPPIPDFSPATSWISPLSVFPSLSEINSPTCPAKTSFNTENLCKEMSTVNGEDSMYSNSSYLYPNIYYPRKNQTSTSNLNDKNLQSTNLSIPNPRSFQKSTDINQPNLIFEHLFPQKPSLSNSSHHQRSKIPLLIRTQSKTTHSHNEIVAPRLLTYQDVFRRRSLTVNDIDGDPVGIYGYGTYQQERNRSNSLRSQCGRDRMLVNRVKVPPSTIEDGKLTITYEEREESDENEGKNDGFFGKLLSAVFGRFH
ncbi:hypothetical protein HK098_002738 [Nowakowskiella sp. JEL0407]|nr:hypothetical protein HK098_002738 [Nowakowskiella sp. JEL0407]